MISNRHFSKLNLYIFFSALRVYWPLKSAFFLPLCLAAKQPYLIPFFYGGTYMYGRDRGQHHLRRAFARCSVSPQVRFISLSSARCSNPSAFSATQSSFSFVMWYRSSSDTFLGQTIRQIMFKLCSLLIFFCYRLNQWQRFENTKFHFFFFR